MPLRLIITRLSVALAMLMMTSCATLSSTGVGRIKNYTVHSDSLPQQFDGYTIAFLSDTHYPSKFSRKRLGRVVRELRKRNPRLLLLGGDYAATSDAAAELFDSLATVRCVDGAYCVLGNHDYRLEGSVSEAAARAGIVLLADKTEFIYSDGAYIAVTGIYNPFKASQNTVSPTEAVPDSVFSLLLVHTPDYAEITDAAVDLVLSGHTHGGQVSLFGIYTPVRNSRYGTRFLRGMNHTDDGVPVITTNGVGTSRRKIRFCVPSELVFITLRRQ